MTAAQPGPICLSATKAVHLPRQLERIYDHAKVEAHLGRVEPAEATPPRGVGGNAGGVAGGRSASRLCVCSGALWPRVSLSNHLSICLSVYLSIYLSVYLSICKLICAMLLITHKNTHVYTHPKKILQD